jgi:hypothetical protein
MKHRLLVIYMVIGLFIWNSVVLKCCTCGLGPQISSSAVGDSFRCYGLHNFVF